MNRKRKYLIWISLSIGLITAYFFTNRFVKSKGYSGVSEFVSSIIVNRSKAENPKRNLEIIISDSAYKKINAARERALSNGVIIPDTNAYVPCTIIVDGQKLKAELRLKGKMLDHVEGDKWSFRIKVKGNGTVWGMKKFSIQHPGTRNYIYDWVYHQFSKAEGIVALNYFFIGVKVNGEHKGVYALEENFAEELLTHNKRTPGPVFRFNPDLFWEFRVNELKGVQLNDEQTKFQSADIDFFDKDELLSKNSSSVYLQEALILMENFRRGVLKASDVFDVNLFAKRHAILDIIGGHHSVDWSDIKFYYNPSTRKIEPISYESFSANKIESIVGEYRCKSPVDYYQDFHDALFSDQEFFTQYIQCLDSMSQSAYVTSFLSSIDDELKENENILFKEFPYKNFDPNIYFNNCQKIKDVLSPRQMVQAYMAENGNLKIAGISSLPCVLKECVINDSLHLPIAGNYWVYCKEASSYPKYNSFKFKNLETIKLNEKDNIVLRYSIPGLKNVFSVKVHNEIFPDLNHVKNNLFLNASNVNSFTDLNIDYVSRRITLNKSEFVIDRNLIFPDSFLLILQPGQKLILSNNANVIFNCGVSAKATEENPIQIICSDSSDCKFFFSNNFPGLNLTHVYFQNFRKKKATLAFDRKYLINLSRTTANLTACSFINCNSDLIQSSESKLKLKNMALYNLTETFLKSFCSEVSGENIIFKNCSSESISADNSKLALFYCKWNNCKKLAIDVTNMSLINLFNSEFKDVKTALKVSKGSSINGREVNAEDVKSFLKVKANIKFSNKARIIFLNSNIQAEVFADADAEEVIFNNGVRVQSSKSKNEN